MLNNLPSPPGAPAPPDPPAGAPPFLGGQGRSAESLTATGWFNLAVSIVALVIIGLVLGGVL